MKRSILIGVIALVLVQYRKQHEHPVPSGGSVAATQLMGSFLP